LSWKLVRDNIKNWASTHGVSGTYRQASLEEYKQALQRKLAEELAEYYERLDAGELYDLQDVLATLIPVADPDKKAWQRHVAKTDRLGMFGDRIMWNPVPADYVKDEIT